jgi:amidohydrolase
MNARLELAEELGSPLGSHPTLATIRQWHRELTTIRRELHANPELGFEEHFTSELVARQLARWGVDEVHRGIGRTGVVGVIRGSKGGDGGRVVGLRADMDALPITEATGLPYASQNAGKMHACGHDGHTAMLLGAAKYLAETRNFAGTAVVIFQPAEEGGGGGREMVKDGMMERFAIEEVYGMHNYPGLPVGQFAIRPGALLASADRLYIDLEGVGGHAARPHVSIDTVLVGAQIINQVQSIVSRNVDPLESAVISFTQFHAGTADNIIPQTARISGTARTLDPAVRDLVEKRLFEVVEGTAKLYGAKAKLTYKRDYPVTRNHVKQTAFAAEVAREIVGNDRVDDNAPPLMGAEDFSYMLEARPGAFIFVGNGDTAGLHHPSYNFNDDAIPVGASYWVRLAETALR